ncbi:MAG: NifU family protein [Anaerolineales bacterium]|nr:NifU family protein [Anaerolineales bacterium]
MPTPSEPDVSNAAQATEADRMRALIESLSAYMEYYHGGGVSLVSFDGETLQVKMTGACRGCKLTPLTLHGWIEGTVRPFFPALKQVEAV